MWQMLTMWLTLRYTGGASRRSTVKLSNTSSINLDESPRLSWEVINLWKLRIQKLERGGISTRQIGFIALKTMSTGLGTCKSFIIISGEIRSSSQFRLNL